MLFSELLNLFYIVIKTIYFQQATIHSLGYKKARNKRAFLRIQT